MAIKAIRAEAGYLAALREVSGLIDLDPAPDSPEGERLGTLVQAYEATHCPIDPPDPIEAIKFRMEQSDVAAKDLVPCSTATEIDRAWADEAQRRLDAYKCGLTQGK